MVKKTKYYIKQELYIQFVLKKQTILKYNAILYFNYWHKWLCILAFRKYSSYFNRLMFNFLFWLSIIANFRLDKSIGTVNLNK